MDNRNIYMLIVNGEPSGEIFVLADDVEDIDITSEDDDDHEG